MVVHLAESILCNKKQQLEGMDRRRQKRNQSQKLRRVSTNTRQRHQVQRQQQLVEQQRKKQLLLKQNKQQQEQRIQAQQQQQNQQQEQQEQRQERSRTAEDMLNEQLARSQRSTETTARPSISKPGSTKPAMQPSNSVTESSVDTLNRQENGARQSSNTAKLRALFEAASTPAVDAEPECQRVPHPEKEPATSTVHVDTMEEKENGDGERNEGVHETDNGSPQMPAAQEQVLEEKTEKQSMFTLQIYDEDSKDVGDGSEDDEDAEVESDEEDEDDKEDEEDEYEEDDEDEEDEEDTTNKEDTLEESGVKHDSEEAGFLEQVDCDRSLGATPVRIPLSEFSGSLWFTKLGPEDEIEDSDEIYSDSAEESEMCEESEMSVSMSVTSSPSRAAGRPTNFGASGEIVNAKAKYLLVGGKRTNLHGVSSTTGAKEKNRLKMQDKLGVSTSTLIKLKRGAELRKEHRKVATKHSSGKARDMLFGQGASKLGDKLGVSEKELVVVKSRQQLRALHAQHMRKHKSWLGNRLSNKAKVLLHGGYQKSVGANKVLMQLGVSKKEYQRIVIQQRELQQLRELRAKAKKMSPAERRRHSVREDMPKGPSLEAVLSHSLGLEYVVEYLRGEFSEENIYFWMECQLFKKHMIVEGPRARAKAAQHIVRTYIDDKAPDKVNISMDESKRTEATVKKTDPRSDEFVNVFDEAQRAVFKLIEADSFKRFQRTDKYVELGELIKGWKDVQEKVRLDGYTDAFELHGDAVLQFLSRGATCAVWNAGGKEPRQLDVFFSLQPPEDAVAGVAMSQPKEEFGAFGRTRRSTGTSSIEQGDPAGSADGSEDDLGYLYWCLASFGGSRELIADRCIPLARVKEIFVGEACPIINAIGSNLKQRDPFAFMQLRTDVKPGGPTGNELIIELNSRLQAKMWLDALKILLSGARHITRRESLVDGRSPQKKVLTQRLQVSALSRKDAVDAATKVSAEATAAQEHMREGTVFTRYDSSGSQRVLVFYAKALPPGCKDDRALNDHVEISRSQVGEDLGCIFWCPPGEKTRSSDRTLPLEMLTDVLLGKLHPVLSTNIARAASHDCCLSLLTGSPALRSSSEGSMTLTGGGTEPRLDAASPITSPDKPPLARKPSLLARIMRRDSVQSNASRRSSIAELEAMNEKHGAVEPEVLSMAAKMSMHLEAGSAAIRDTWLKGLKTLLVRSHSQLAAVDDWLAPRAKAQDDVGSVVLHYTSKAENELSVTIMRAIEESEDIEQINDKIKAAAAEHAPALSMPGEDDDDDDSTEEVVDDGSHTQLNVNVFEGEDMGMCMSTHEEVSEEEDEEEEEERAQEDASKEGAACADEAGVSPPAQFEQQTRQKQRPLADFFGAAGQGIPQQNKNNKENKAPEVFEHKEPEHGHQVLSKNGRIGRGVIVAKTKFETVFV